MTSMPASRSARAMIFAPRSWPSRPGFAITTRIFRATEPILNCGRLLLPPGTLLRDEVAVPVEAPLRHPLERRIVDVDESKALPVAPCPLEVVHQRPDEVALDRDTRLDSAADRRDVPFEVVTALRIAHAAVVTAHVRKRRAILRDVQRARRVVVADPDEQIVDAVGIDLPVHVGVLRVGLAHVDRRAAAGIG